MFAALRFPRSRRTVGVPFGSAVALTALALSACGGSDAPDAERFCGEVEANRDALTDPDLTSEADIEPFLDLYRSIGALAPLAIEPDWERLTSAYEIASTVVPGDVESEQTALAAIFATEQSAAAVDEWLQANCAVDIGPVFTIVEQNAPPVTVPPATVDDE